MKISDYVIKFIADLGVDKVFCVTGGGAMHLNNSLGSSSDVEGVFMLHEQGASIAAESYARIREGYGVFRKLILYRWLSLILSMLFE